MTIFIILLSLVFPVTTNIIVYPLNALEILSKRGFVFERAYFPLRFLAKTTQ